ncbi:MAG TPA: D-glycero-beta-D-manno-heptose 1-phosphate adenylyltransferase [Chitinophagaceae bacterium]|jgi:D-beta-D-heptose 7-phosphate kinase/D-beta-D-heptose 1-phosphate adenosyltransferase|nr:D-glycero-beta-D-manno-heptose 1-phosphate adenylyltransferase [Chitinophagaceae bacterium]
MAAASIAEKIYSLTGIIEKTGQWKKEGKKIVFTNGVFDLLHKGHIFSLTQAAKEGDVLVIGLNSDGSVKRLKGDSRPINEQDARALLLAALTMVDAVVVFEEDTPLKLITSILPNVLVKGGDYTVDEIAGAREVIANGGKIVINPILDGFSTTAIIKAISQ